MSGAILEKGGERRRIYFDSVQSEEWSIETEISEHPTIEKETITDNAEKMAPSLSITGRITAYPLRRSPFGDLPREGEKRLNEAVRLMRELATEIVFYKSPRFGYTEDGLYGDVSYTLVRESHVDFSFSFTEIDIATQQQVEIPPERVPKPTNKPEKDSGKKQTDDEENEVDDDQPFQSFLSQGGEAGGAKAETFKGSTSYGSAF